MRQEEMTTLAASLDIGMLADRTLFLFKVKNTKDFDARDRELLSRDAEVLNALFLDSAETLLRSGNTAYLASSQTGWLESLAERAQAERPRSSEALLEWVRSSVQVASKVAEGKSVGQKEKERLLSLLDAVSAVTYEYIERRQQEPRFEGSEWSQRLITTV